MFQNYFHLKVEFPGIGNDMKLDIPFEITSGLVAPFVEAEAPLYDGPPAALDLPPYIPFLLTFEHVTENYATPGNIGLRLIGMTLM